MGVSGTIIGEIDGLPGPDPGGGRFWNVGDGSMAAGHVVPYISAAMLQHERIVAVPPAQLMVTQVPPPILYTDPPPGMNPSASYVLPQTGLVNAG